MLTDPFYEDAPAYSGSSTGVIEIPELIGIDAISLLQMMKSILEEAGWTAAGNFPSTGVQSAVQLPVAVPPVPPRPLIPHPIGCSGSVNPQAIQASVNGVDYIAYDPYVYILPTDCADRIFYPVGLTPQDTADALAVALTVHSSFSVQYTGDVGAKHQFKFTSKAPAWEADAEPILVNGGGSHFTTKGYYTLRSETTDEGGFLEARLHSYAMNGSFGINADALVGTLTPFLRVRASGGGEYAQAIYNSGTYSMCASKYQFAIWCDRDGRTGSELVASLLKPDAGHTTGANGAVAYGSESYSWLGSTGNFTQVTRQLHWEESFATGFVSSLEDVGAHTQESDTTLWRAPTVLLRGLRGLALKTTTGYPLVQSPYVLLSSDPNHHSEDRIGGRMWDMIVASDNALFTGLTDQNGMALYDQKHWIKLATASINGDVTSSLWIKQEADS